MLSPPIFQEYGIINVTNFDATPENPDLGYLCGGIVMVFSDGNIRIHDANEGGGELDSFHLRDLIRMNTNINSFDPDHTTEIALLKQEKSIRISFYDAETKNQLAETLRNLAV